MRTIATALIAALVLVLFVGCGGNGDEAASAGFAPDQSVEAYSYVHGGYVGKAEVTTDDEGEIDVTIDEAFLPHTLAIVDLESDDWNEDNTVSYVVRGDTVHVAKYIAYDGTDYVGNTVGTALVYVAADEDGEPDGNTVLEKMILRNEDTMAAWFDNIADGGFETYTEFGGEANTVTTTSYGSLTKRGSEYWNFDLGWEGNMEAIESAAEEYGVGYALDEMTQEDGEWTLADATTGATASDFKDYFSLIQQAVARLEMAN
ncbi:MAG: hypothetical protein ACQETQ_07725 [Spirochaetota bacterium]